MAGDVDVLAVRCADSIRRLISTRSIRYPPQLPPFTSLFHIYADPAPEFPRPVMGLGRP